MQCSHTVITTSVARTCMEPSERSNHSMWVRVLCQIRRIASGMNVVIVGIVGDERLHLATDEWGGGTVVPGAMSPARHDGMPVSGWLVAELIRVRR